MQFNSTGGIFLRLDSSGNLNIYDTSGTSILKFLSGAASIKGNLGTLVSNTVTTTGISTTNTYVGYNVNFTPQVSTRALILAPWAGSNNTVNNDLTLSVMRNTGTSNPSGGSAAAGLQILGSIARSATANATGNLTIAGIDTELTAGTAYTYSLAAQTSPGGTGSLGFLAHATADIFMVVEL